MMYNKDMKKGRLRKGFTIIEVVLFLAISGAILAAILSNTSATVARRRYNDTVNDYVEEIRNAYSATINVENYRKNIEDSSYFCSVSSAFGPSGLQVNSPVDQVSIDKTADNYPGRTRCAVYGQIITFGEDNKPEIHRYDLIGLAIAGDYDGTNNANKNQIRNNIDPDEKSGDDVLLGLEEVGANIITMTQVPINAPGIPTTCKASLAGTTTEHTSAWTGRIENKKDRNLYKGAIMIARSPFSGTVHTYFYSNSGNISNDNPFADETFYVQKWLRETTTSSCGGFGAYRNKFAAIDMAKWRNDKPLDLCVGSEEDMFAVGDKRRAIRIHPNGSTESSVELLTEIDSEAVCKTN